MKNKSIDLSVIIPAYNEAKRIKPTIRQVFMYIQKNYQNGEIIIINDGSKDDTEKVVMNYIAHQKKSKIHFRLINHKRNYGKGRAVKTGIIKATKDWILVMDADSATPITEISKLFKNKKHAEVIYGSRYLDRSLLKLRQPMARRIIGRLGNLLARIVLGIKLVDTQCGFKLFSRCAAQKIFPKACIARWGWDLEVLVIAQAQNLQIAEIPVVWRHIGGSTFRASRGIRQTFFELFTIRRNLHKGIYN